MIEGANGAGRRAEEGLAAFCSFIFYKSPGLGIYWEANSIFSPRFFLYIHVLIILGPNICFLVHIFIYSGGWLHLHFLSFFPLTHLDPDGVERHGEKAKQGRRVEERRRALVSGNSVRVCVCTT